VSLLGALSIEACALDHRRLARRTDATETDAETDSSSPPARTNVHLIDSGAIDYSSDGATHDSAPPKPSGNGPCVHVDAQGMPDCDRTLVSNADFNKDIGGWAPENGAELRWVEFDSQGAKGSGALAVKNAQHGDVDGTVGVAGSQCIPVAENTTYAYEASIFIKRGQAYGQGQILVFFYTEPGCQGLVQSAYAVTGVQSTETWLHAVGINLKVPATVQSMGVRLHVEKPFRTDTLEVLFDAVRVTLLPVSP
jgi:hypothetical protein